MNTADRSIRTAISLAFPKPNRPQRKLGSHRTNVAFSPLERNGSMFEHTIVMQQSRIAPSRQTLPPECGEPSQNDTLCQF